MSHEEVMHACRISFNVTNVALQTTEAYMIHFA